MVFKLITSETKVSTLNNENQIVFAGSLVILPFEATDWDADSNDLFPADTYFRKIHIAVYSVRPNDDGTYTRTSEYRPISFDAETVRPIETGPTKYYKDIHQAIESLFAKEDRTPPLEITDSNWKQGFIRFQVSAYTSYTTSTGTEVNNQGNGEVLIRQAFAFRGRLSEAELDMTSFPTEVKIDISPGTIRYLDIPLTNKPLSGEPVVIGQPYTTETIQQDFTEDESGKRIYEEPIIKSSVYMIESSNTPKNAHLIDTSIVSTKVFAFGNSLESSETIIACTLEEEKYNIEKQYYRVNTLNGRKVEPGDISVLKSQPQLQYEMSSGPVSHDWAVWWATQFLTAKRHWLKGKDANGIDAWLPCTVEPAKKSVTTLNKTKAEAIHIDFTVTMTKRC